MYLIREDTSISSVFMWMFFGLFITGGVSFWTIDNSEVMNSHKKDAAPTC
jgi:hypothetical protein